MDRPTSFELSLPGPTLEAPLLFARHFERIDVWLRSHYRESDGYRVHATKVSDARRLQWTLQLDAGWFSGLEVELKPEKEEPHKARLSVHWSTRFLRGLNYFGVLLGVLPALVFLGVGVKLIGSLLIVGFLMIPLVFVWVFAVGAGAALMARGAAQLAGNAFDSARREEIALQLKGLSLQTHLRK